MTRRNPCSAVVSTHCCVHRALSQRRGSQLAAAESRDRAALAPGEELRDCRSISCSAASISRAWTCGRKRCRNWRTRSRHRASCSRSSCGRSARPAPGESQRYEIIAGERRWRASQLAGLTDIPAVIRHVPDETAIAVALIENIQRENLNSLEEARALERLITEFELTHQQRPKPSAAPARR